LNELKIGVKAIAVLVTSIVTTASATLSLLNSRLFINLGDRGMWVFCCGMYRSASTLQFQITSRLVKDAGIGQQIGWIDALRFDAVRDRHADDQGFKVIKVHTCTEPIAAEFLWGNALGIYTFRDIRDVFVSSMKQRAKSFDDVWQEGFIDQCLENYKRWTQLPNVLISRYETIIQDLPSEVSRIAHHLGLSLEASQCHAIAADYSIEMQQERVQKFTNSLLQMTLAPNDHREIVDYHDEETLLHMNHINSGQAGQWKEDLSAQEAALICDRVKRWCAENACPASAFLRYAAQEAQVL
jgi:hypothetical protein